MWHTEAETRKELIDNQLRLAGWHVDDPSQVVVEYDIDLISAGVVAPIAAVSGAVSTHYGHQYVDYVLMLRGRPVAVIEAKRTSKDAELGKEQGLRYAENLQRLLGGPIPFVLFTNGHEIYLWDAEQYPPMRVHGFPTPLDLAWMDQRRRTRRPLSVELIDTQISGRGYQTAAIRLVLEGIEASKRNFLLVMATGTGKTRTAMGLMDVLLRAQWAKRILCIDPASDGVDALPYHLVHRAWSAWRSARDGGARRAAFLVHSFVPVDATGSGWPDFVRFAVLLYPGGPAVQPGVPCWVQRLEGVEFWLSWVSDASPPLAAR